MKKGAAFLLILIFMPVTAVFPTVAAQTEILLGYTSFEEPQLATQLYTDTASALVDHPLQNHVNEPVVNVTSSGGELGFRSSYTNTRSSDGLTDGDAVGVTSSAASYPDGSQGYQLSDTDGAVTVMLDAVLLTGVTAPTVTLNYYVQPTSWESDDLIRIWLVLDGSTTINLLNTSGQDIDSMNIEGSWRTLTRDLSGYDSAVLYFLLDSNSSLETLFVDNIRFTGTVANLPQIAVSQSISAEPLLADQVTYQINVQNNGQTPVVDRGYNLTITDTLGAELNFVSAVPMPTFASPQEDGSTVLVWENIADLEAGEALSLAVTAELPPSLTLADPFANLVEAAFNDAPDNSGVWLQDSSSLTAVPQAIDIEMQANQSTANDQATGAGEYTPAADWPYTYQITIANNNLANTENVVATAVLPPGVAYLGNPQISPNPNGSSATPSLSLKSDGSLALSWNLGTLTPAQNSSPVEITFAAAIPYRFRTAADNAAASGPFAGPMSGAILHEDALMRVSYEATGSFNGSSTADGTTSTPADDTAVRTTADYFTIHKSAAPATVGIGTAVTYTLTTAVSEYFNITNGVLVDILPDGVTYVPSSASQAPASVQADTPTKGQTTLTWNLSAGSTTAGSSGTITFQATVDATYTAPAYAGQPIVSGDSLTNQATLYGDWVDVVSNGRTGTTTPDSATATVQTRMPTFSKVVRHPLSSAWVSQAPGFVGDTLTFRLTYSAAADVDAKEIIIRDFLPRGMSYVPNSATYSTSGSFSSSGSCSSAPTTAVTGTLNGLQYLEWRLCNTGQGSSWQVTLNALVGPVPQVQSSWLVANFGKLSGQNTAAEPYSQRDMAAVDYVAPDLALTKTASPAVGLQADDLVVYTIAVTNNGDATAYNLVVTDLVPADLLVANSGGSASPASSSYGTTSGNPASGSGGTLQWSTIASLAPGNTQTFQYSATVPSGLVAGQSMTNLASVAYNSRPDNNGHAVAATANPDDANTDDETVYMRGVTAVKTASPTTATIGDTVTWTITGTIPSGVVAYWPIVEENNLPNGFDYVPGSTTLSSSTGTVTFDPAHGDTPLDNGSTDLRWFLSPITNLSGSDQTFTLGFDTLMTGVNSSSLSQLYYTGNCCNQNADNDAYVAWYDAITGYNNTGSAYDGGFGTNNVDRRSPEADGDVTIQQPYLTLDKRTNYTYMAAGGVLAFTLEIRNTGKATAYDIQVTDALPAPLTFWQTSSATVAPDGGEIVTDGNSVGSQSLVYGLDALPAGSVWTIQYAVDIDSALEAGLVVQNSATVSSYSSQPGIPADSNGDTLADERVYTGPTDAVTLYAPTAELLKTAVLPNELTYGSTMTYTLTVPQTPIPAIMHDVIVTDVVDGRLTVLNVTNGSFDGNTVTANFATIGLNSQETVVVEVQLAEDSTAVDGDLISNSASLAYRHDPATNSNSVVETAVAPALVVDINTETFSVAQNDVVTYTVTLQNVGRGVAQNLSLSSLLPANFTLVNGSTRLNDQAFANPVAGVWDLSAHDLAWGETHTLQFQAQVNSVAQGVAYVNTAVASGTDSLGNPIPANNSQRVPADSDLDDSASITVYGPLTCNQESSNVSFEDLKNTGWSDWDYNDLIVRIDTQLCLATGSNLAIVNVDYLAVARGAGFTHSFHHDLPVNGTGRYQLTVRDDQGGIVLQQNGRFTTAPDFSIFADTKQIFAQPPAGCNGDFECLSYVNTMQGNSAYRNGYTAVLSVLLNNAAQNPASSLTPTPWDPYIKVFNTGEEVHRVIVGHLDNSQQVTNTYDPGNAMIGHDLPLVQTFAATWDWPVEFSGIWRGYPNYVAYIASGGTTNLDWLDLANANTDYLWTYAPLRAMDWMLERLLGPAEVQATSRYFAGATAADLNGDGKMEYILGNLLADRVEVYNQMGMLLWQRPVNGGVKTAVTVADFRPGVAGPELLVSSEDGYLYAFHADGTAVSGWPVQVGGDNATTFRVLSSAAVANLDNTGGLEVVVAGSNGRLYVFNANGSSKWNSSLGDVLDSFGSQVINSSPTIGDLDGDGWLEIVVGAYNGKLYAFRYDGSLLWTFTTGDVIMGSAIIANIDPDADGNEVMLASGDGKVTLLDEGGEILWQRATGWSVRSTPLVVDIDNNGDLEIFVGSDDDRLWAWHHTGTAVTGWPKTTGADLFASPAAGDIDGDGQLEIVAASDDGKVYAWEKNGTAVPGWPVAQGSSIKGRPALVNLDNDAALEVVVGNIDGKTTVIGGFQSVYLPIVIR